MLLYLDICCFNRPYDDQTQTRIRIETDAKLALQELIRQKKVTLIWSYVLDFENKFNPFPERAAAIQLWRNLALRRVRETQQLLDKGRELAKLGLKTFDALHVACAISANANIFVTTDDTLLRKLKGHFDIIALPPADALAQVENWYEN
jgi:predicted nucleic acid-binding protein